MKRMKNALDEMFITGIDTNLTLHRQIIAYSAFAAGGLHLHYLAIKHPPSNL